MGDGPIFDAIEFFRYILPPEPGSYRPYTVKFPYSPSETPTTFQALADWCLDRRDVYVSLGSWTDRRGGELLAVRAFRIDIDCPEHYPSPQGAIQAVDLLVAGKKIPPPLILNSGGGVNLLWALDEPITDKAEWRRRAKGLGAHLLALGVRFDGTRTEDCSNGPRVPGSFNSKRGQMVRVARWAETIGRDTWDRLIPAAAAPPPLSLGDLDLKRRPDSWVQGVADAGRSFYADARDTAEVSADQIADRCAQMRAFRSGEHLGESVWVNLLHIVAKCRDGDTIAHEWSARDGRYREEETAHKLSFAEQKDYKPTSCEWFRKNNGAVCARCPENVRSPISLGKIAAPEPEDAPEDPPKDKSGKAICLPPGYSNKNGLIWTDVSTSSKNATIPIKVEVCTEIYCLGLTYIDGYRKYKWLMARTGEEFFLERSKCNTKNFELADKMWWCAPKFFDAYIAAATMQVELTEDLQLYKTLGWHRGALITGEDIESLTEELKPLAKKIVRYGELDKSLGAVRQLFDHPDFELYAYPVLVSAGAPLHHLVGPEEGGSILLLRSSTSGQGKTTALAGAMSLWGLWQKLGVASIDTPNDQRLTFSQLSHLPVGWDEAVRSNQQFKLLALEFAAGRPRGRLTQTGERRKSDGRWSTFLIATTNTPYKLQLSTADGATGGELARILELNLQFPKGFDWRDGGRLLNSFSEHYGHIGYALRQEYENYENKIRNRLKSESERRAIKLDHSALRLISRQITCAEAAGHVLVKLFPNYFKVEDIDRIIRKIEALVIQDFKQQSASGQDIFNRFVSDNLEHLIRPGKDPRCPIMGGLAGSTLMIPGQIWLKWIANRLSMSHDEAFERLRDEGYHPYYEEDVDWMQGLGEPEKCLIIKGRKQSAAKDEPRGNIIRPPEFLPDKPRLPP